MQSWQFHSFHLRAGRSFIHFTRDPLIRLYSIRFCNHVYKDSRKKLLTDNWISSRNWEYAIRSPSQLFILATELPISHYFHFSWSRNNHETGIEPVSSFPQSSSPDQSFFLIPKKRAWRGTSSTWPGPRTRCPMWTLSRPFWQTCDFLIWSSSPQHWDFFFSCSKRALRSTFPPG